MDKKERKGLAIGAALGAVAGVVTGILFAPKSGKETRQDIKDAAGTASEKLQTEAKKLQTEAKLLIKKVESSKATTAAKKHAKDLQHAASNLATVAKAFKNGKASDKDLDKAVKQAKAARTSVKKFLKK